MFFSSTFWSVGICASLVIEILVLAYGTIGSLLFSVTLQTPGQNFVVVVEIAGGLVGEEGPGFFIHSICDCAF